MHVKLEDVVGYETTTKNTNICDCWKVDNAIDYGATQTWYANGSIEVDCALLPGLYAIRQYADGNTDEESIKNGFNKLFGIR